MSVAAPRKTRNMSDEKGRELAAVSRFARLQGKAALWRERLLENPILPEWVSTEDQVAIAMACLNHSDIYRCYDQAFPHLEYIDQDVYLGIVLSRTLLAELHVNPWARAMVGQCQPEQPLLKNSASRKESDSTVALRPFPNFLLPTSCLVCGEDLGFTDYKSTRRNRVVHDKCQDRWNKRISNKIKPVFQLTAKSFEAEDALLLNLSHFWDAYKSIADVLSLTYIPRYTLIKEYESIVFEEVWNCFRGMTPLNALKDFPFLDPIIKELELFLEDVDSPNWNFRNKTFLVSELKSYFMD